VFLSICSRPTHKQYRHQARSKQAGLSIWEMSTGKLLNGAATTSLLALPAGALQFGMFSFAKRSSLAPSWLSHTAVELVAGRFSSSLFFFGLFPR